MRWDIPDAKHSSPYMESSAFRIIPYIDNIRDDDNKWLPYGYQWIYKYIELVKHVISTGGRRFIIRPDKSSLSIRHESWSSPETSESLVMSAIIRNERSK